MVLKCFGRGAAQPRDAQKETEIELEQLRSSCAAAKVEQDRLVALNEQLQNENTLLKKKATEAEATVSATLDSMNAQLAKQVEDTRRVARAATEARIAAAKQDEKHQEEFKRLSMARKADQASLLDSQAKVHSLDQRVLRYQRERTKLLDQITRRDQALFLARQVIDMVEKSGVLGLEGAAGLMGPAFSPPPSSQPSGRKVTSSSKGGSSPRPKSSRPAPPEDPVRLSNQQLALEELRKSLPAMRAALCATASSPVVDSAATPLMESPSVPSARTAVTSPAVAPTSRSAIPAPSVRADVSADTSVQADGSGQQRASTSPAARTRLRRSSSGEVAINPLWQPAAAFTDEATNSPLPAEQGRSPATRGLSGDGSIPMARELEQTRDVRAMSDMSPRCRVVMNASKESALSIASRYRRVGSSSGGSDVAHADQVQVATCQ